MDIKGKGLKSARSMFACLLAVCLFVQIATPGYAGGTMEDSGTPDDAWAGETAGQDSENDLPVPGAEEDVTAPQNGEEPAEEETPDETDAEEGSEEDTQDFEEQGTDGETAESLFAPAFGPYAAGVETAGNESQLSAAFADPSVHTILLTGDIDLTGPLTISGNRTLTIASDTQGIQRTIYQTESLERHIEIDGNMIAVNLTFEDVVLDGMGAGGGILSGTSDLQHPDLTLRGAVIQNCLAEHGGGVYAYGRLVVSNCSIYNNSADIHGLYSEVGYGGGIYTSGTLTITGSFIEDNSAGNVGGGIYAVGVLEISNSEIKGNESMVGGGGLYYHGITPGSNRIKLDDVTIDDNFTVGRYSTQNPNGGGGAYIRLTVKTTVEIYNSKVINNQVENSNGAGLFIVSEEAVAYIDEHNIKIHNTLFQDNECVYGYNAMGGGLYLNARTNGPTQIYNCTFEENISDFRGGAMLLASTAHVKDCTIEVILSTMEPLRMADRAVHFISPQTTIWKTTRLLRTARYMIIQPCKAAQFTLTPAVTKKSWLPLKTVISMPIPLKSTNIIMTKARAAVFMSATAEIR